MGFIMHFYIIFGTNLLTEGPVRIVVFLPISVFRRKGISNGIQMEWNLRESYFWNKHNPGDLDPTSRNKGGGHEVGGRAHPPGAPSTLVGPLLLHRRTSSSYIYLRTPNQQKHPLKPNSTAATFCTREIPSWGLFQRSARGALITEGFYINTIASPMMCE